MNKKLNTFLRVLTVVAASAAAVFAFLLKGKMDVALTNTAWAVTDAEVKADYDKFKAQASGTEYRASHILVEKEDEAKALIAQGCDVIFSNAQDTPSVIAACEEAGVYAFNLNSSMKSCLQ